MISASVSTLSLNNLKLLRPKVMKNFTNLPKKPTREFIENDVKKIFWAFLDQINLKFNSMSKFVSAVNIPHNSLNKHLLNFAFVQIWKWLAYENWLNYLNNLQESISSSCFRAHFAPIFLRQKLQSWNVTRESCAKHFCIKNTPVKCWWNWLQQGPQGQLWLPIVWLTSTMSANTPTLNHENYPHGVPNPPIRKHLLQSASWISAS